MFNTNRELSFTYSLCTAITLINYFTKFTFNPLFIEAFIEIIFAKPSFVKCLPSLIKFIICLNNI